MTAGLVLNLQDNLMLMYGAGDCVDERFLHVNGPCFLFGVGTIMIINISQLKWVYLLCYSYSRHCFVYLDVVARVQHLDMPK